MGQCGSNSFFNLPVVFSLVSSCKQFLFSFLFTKIYQFFPSTVSGFVSNLKSPSPLILCNNSPNDFYNFAFYISVFDPSGVYFMQRAQAVIRFDCSVPNGPQKQFCISSFPNYVWGHTKKPGNWCYFQLQIPQKTHSYVVHGQHNHYYS